MSDQHGPVQALCDWAQVSRDLEIALAGLTESDLNFKGGPHGWSIRETVHHLVESNLVAGTIVIAAVGAGGCTFDCSWMNPDQTWMERMAYRGSVTSAMVAMSAVCRHASDLLQGAPGGLGRAINLLGPEATSYPMTVEQMVRLEVEHARNHLLEIEEMLKEVRR